MYLGKHLHILGQHAAVEGFVGIVDLAQDVVGVFIGNGMNIRVARPGEALFEVESQIAYDIEVGTDGDIDVGPLHLDHDLLTIGQRSTMHLGSRGSSQRFLVKGGIELVNGCAEAHAVMIFSAVSKGNGATLLCSLAICSRHSGGSCSARLDTIWPSLT